MLIKLRCKNPSCLYPYEITEDELIDNGELHKYCFLCGGEVEILNLKEIVNTDIERKVKNNVDKWFKEIGIEATIELCEKNSNSAMYRLYAQELRRRGLRPK